MCKIHLLPWCKNEKGPEEKGSDRESLNRFVMTRKQYLVSPSYHQPRRHFLFCTDALKLANKTAFGWLQVLGGTVSRPGFIWDLEGITEIVELAWFPAQIDLNQFMGLHTSLITYTINGYKSVRKNDANITCWFYTQKNVCHRRCF